jgi:hypothetical protein
LQLAEERVIERLRNGRFNLDDSRVRYIRWLRDPERRSARTQADADFVKAKTELIAIRIREKKRELIEIEEAKEIMDKAIGVTLVAMSGMSARIAGRDLEQRRRIDRIVYETRVELATILNKLADEAGEPPLEQAPTTDDTVQVT